jgi:hypothetical protein
MPIKLAQFLNKPIQVAIPSLFGDQDPRLFTLIEIEPAGLWLNGEDLKGRCGRGDEAAPIDVATATAFFPFSEILYVFDPTQFAALARGGVVPLEPTQVEPQPPAARTLNANQRTRRGQSQQETRKPRR